MQTKKSLLNALGNRQLVVVVGTGVTTALTGGAPTSSWLGLIQDGIDHVEKRDTNKAALFKLRVDSVSGPDDLVSIAHDLKRELGDDFGRWMSRSVGDLPLVDPSVAIALGKLGVPILTTNYDDLLERALGQTAATWQSPSEMRRVLRHESLAIGHLHGVCGDEASIIFSQADYQRIMDDVDAQKIQTGAFDLLTFLFIGVGDGLADPNFSPMVTEFAKRFPSTPNTHFRLCRDSEVDATTELKSVVDVGYGASHSDLAPFLENLASSASAPDVNLGAKSRVRLLDRLRDTSTLWSDADALNDKTVSELVVPPIFLPEPHDQYATNSVLNSQKDKPPLIDLTQTVKDGGIVIVAGEESAGVSTALAYCLARSLDVRPNSHALLVDDPLVSGSHPVKKIIDRAYREWGIENPAEITKTRLALGVDNLRFDTSARFEKAIADIVSSEAGLKIIGVRQTDAVEIARVIRERTDRDVSVVFLGRFSNVEALELARRVAPGREVKVATYVMVVIREKNLPRTPFTITLLVALIQSGVNLQKRESEIAVLDQYLDLLLGTEFGRVNRTLNMTVRNKRVALEVIARNFVEEREDKAPRSKVQNWLEVQFDQLGWAHDVSQCIDDLVDRRVLSRAADNTISFQRSAYLELMAGLAAKDDTDFRNLVFSSPIQLASIVRTYAAMTRNDKDVLEVVEKEIARIAVGAPNGSVFKSVRQVDAKKELFAERPESSSKEVDASTRGEGSVEREGMTGQYYDDSDDSDTPAFLTARLEDLPPSRVAMLVVDLASRVLRDSDEVRDQELKKRVLRQLLVAWVMFTDLYETELAALPELHDIVAAFFPESAEDEEKLTALKDFLPKIAATMLTTDGLRYCLGGPSLVTRLAELDLRGIENGQHASTLRTIALYTSGDLRWIETLVLIDDDAIKTFYSAAYLTAVARYAFITDERLSEAQRAEIRSFLRRVIDVRYSFKGVDHRVEVMNRMEAQLRNDRLLEGRRDQNRAITIA